MHEKKKRKSFPPSTFPRLKTIRIASAVWGLGAPTQTPLGELTKLRRSPDTLAGFQGEWKGKWEWASRTERKGLGLYHPKNELDPSASAT